MKFRLIVPPSLGAARTSARAELLASSLGTELGLDIDVRIARAYDELRDQVTRAEVELAWAPAAVLAQVDDARAVLRAVRGGHAEYHSAILARAGAGISLASLSGRRAAWVDPLSIGGHLLAVRHLRKQGIEPNLVFDRQDFLGSHRAVVDALLDGTYDVAAVSAPASDAASLQRAVEFYAGGAEGKLTVIGVTDSAPTDAFLVTTCVDPEEAERIAARLAPPKGRRAPSFLLTAMEAERLERTDLAPYHALKSLLWGRRSLAPSP